MKSILREIYDDQLPIGNNQLFKKLTKPHEELEERLLEVLGNNTQLFDEFIDNYHESQGDLPFLNFKQGFILGSKIMLEVLQED
jgi:hypothetical protein